jgi:hypothetical protein
MRRLLVFGLALGMAVGTIAAPATAKAPHKKNFVVVEGGYVNDVSCIPSGPPDVSPEGDALSGSCRVSSLWDGAWTGRTLGTLTYTVDLQGNISGTYEETLYAVYLPDGSSGSIHFTGTFSVDGATSVFHADAVIDGGTCAFEGSKGTFTADGHSLHGGYRAEWYRSPTASATDPSCLI